MWWRIVSCTLHQLTFRGSEQTICDLLGHSTNLAVKEDPLHGNSGAHPHVARQLQCCHTNGGRNAAGPMVSGMDERVLKSADEAMAFLAEGERNR